MLAAASALPNLPRLNASGLLTCAEVATSDVLISVTGGRHAGLRIERATGLKLYVKQAFTQTGAAALAHEARVTGLLASAPDEALHALVPALSSHDADAAVLATELVPNGQTLHRCVVRAPSAALEAAAALGRGLANFHSSGAVVPAFGEAACPDVLSLHRPTPAFMERLSVAGLRLVELVQEHAGFGFALDALRAAWAPTAPTHNDLKWDNIIVSVTPHNGRFEGVTLVDWESAGLGDPGWDIGSFFAAGLGAWARAQPDDPDQAAGAAPPAEHYPLPLIQLLSRAFWMAYLEQRMAEPPLGMETVRYCAARLVQTALELTQDRLEPAGESTRLLQLALNILQRPDEASTVLLGFDIPGTPVHAAAAPAREPPQERPR